MRDRAAILAAIGKPAAGEGREASLAAGELVDAMSRLKGLGDFMLLDIVAVDRPDAFELAYRLLDRGGEGPVGLFTIRLRADKGDPKLPSVMGVWKAADVLEREVWDLMGVVFEGRGEMKRLLCKDDFEGHPLRKDFAVARTPRFPEGPEGARP